MNRATLLFLCFTVVFAASYLVACGGGRIQYDIDERPIDPTQIPKDRLQVKNYDTNKDGSPDVYEYYRLVVAAGSPSAAPVPTLVMKEMAVDFGPINVWRVYLNNGEVYREWFDTTGDGRYNVETFFVDNKVAKKRYDVRNDGKPDMWKVFDRNGLMVERSLDTTGDGKPDMWEFYEGGLLKRTKRDLDGDGQPD